MKLFNLIRRAVPHSVLMQLQAFEQAEEVEWQKVKQNLYGGEKELHFENPNPDLTPMGHEPNPYETKKINQMQAWASRQLKIAYRELNPAVKDGKQ